MNVVIVSGALANKRGNGGEAWVRLSWALGLRRLGFDVYFVEQIDPATCRNDVGDACEFLDSANLAYFREVTRQFGLAERSSLICGAGEACAGISLAQLLDVADGAEMLVNISGHLKLESLMRRLRRKAYVDIDPGFTQFWHADPATDFRLAGHDFYFTIGENIGTPGCAIPTEGINWHHVRQPVVLDDWPVARQRPGEGSALRFTTVASWRGAFGPVQHDGKTYGQKAHEFRKMLDLPRRSPGIFEIALDIHPGDAKDLVQLRENGWRIVDPHTAAGDPASFRRYVEESSAEFSVAQGIYVDTNSGWFSDRTVRYLAAGRPALVQETGFSRNLPAGEGLVAFRTPDDARRGAARIADDYDAHRRAARQLAESHFDSDKVLAGFLDVVGVIP